MNNESKIGIAFLLFCGILVWLTVLMRGCPLTPKTELHVKFPSLEGLKRGDDVIFRGVTIGKISGISLTADGGVATCALERAQVYDNGVFVIPERVQAHVEDTTVLGGKRIVIEPLKARPGQEVKPFPIGDPSRPMQGKVREPIVRSFAKIGEHVAALTEDGGPVDRVAKRLEAAADNIATITEKIKDGEGTIGQLLANDSLYKNVDKFFEHGSLLVENLRKGKGALGRLLVDEEMGARFDRVTRAVDEGKGTLGALIHERQLHDNLLGTVERLRELGDRVAAGDGTIGRLFNDTRLYDHAADVFENADAILKDVRGGKGTVGRLFAEDDLYDNLLKITDDLKNVSSKLNSQDGTLGVLINNRQIIDKADKAIDDAAEIFDAFGRFRTFAGVGYWSHAKQRMSVTRIYMRIEPSPDKFFYGGVAILGLDKDGSIAYEGQFDGERADDSYLVPEAAIGWRFFDRFLTMRIGFIEGKLGGGFDFDFTIPGLESMPIRFSAEGRLPYNDRDLDDDDIDEDVKPFVARVYGSVLLMDRLRIYAGANNLFDQVGFTFGASFEYRDEDLRSMVGFLALGS